jgi:succinate-semialdehyde dehydrogenase/glutarate-semialdehyde dehydrogenase
MSYRTLNPATGELVEEFSEATDHEVEAALAAATRAYEPWRRLAATDRGAVLTGISAALERGAGEYGRLMALEMGKPLAQGEAEARKCAWVCRHYAECGDELLRPVPHPSDGSEAFVRYDPLGPLLAIMPWNFPFWQVFRFAAPALVAGNVVLLKHAPSTPRCALAITRLCNEAGLPEGAFQNLFLSNEQVARLIDDPRLRGVTLTGSSRAGRAVARQAGASLKPMVLELGGSDPFIVLDDANLEEAAEVGVTSRCLNSGQSCIAAKRFLVDKRVFDPFVEAFVERMEAQKVGDPLAAGVQIGPLAREDLRDQLAAQVSGSLAAGARALCGGRPVQGKGFFYPPTVLVDVPAHSAAGREELFGPVATLIPFSSDEEMLRIANGTRYGLGASLWTSNRMRVEQLLPEIEAGAVFVNGLVKSDPRLPFGGVKDSGFGRELAREGLLEWVNQKTVWVR